MNPPPTIGNSIVKGDYFLQTLDMSTRTYVENSDFIILVHILLSTSVVCTQINTKDDSQRSILDHKIRIRLNYFSIFFLFESI